MLIVNRASDVPHQRETQSLRLHTGDPSPHGMNMHGTSMRRRTISYLYALCTRTVVPLLDKPLLHAAGLALDRSVRQFRAGERTCCQHNCCRPQIFRRAAVRKVQAHEAARRHQQHRRECDTWRRQEQGHHILGQHGMYIGFRDPCYLLIPCTFARAGAQRTRLSLAQDARAGRVQHCSSGVCSPANTHRHAVRTEVKHDITDGTASSAAAASMEVSATESSLQHELGRQVCAATRGWLDRMP